MSQFINPALYSPQPIQDFEPGDQYIDDDPAESLPQPCRRIFVGTGGDVEVVSPTGKVAVYKNLPDAFYLEGPFVQIKGDNTTAMDLIVEY